MRRVSGAAAAVWTSGPRLPPARITARTGVFMCSYVGRGRLGVTARLMCKESELLLSRVTCRHPARPGVDLRRRASAAAGEGSRPACFLTWPSGCSSARCCTQTRCLVMIYCLAAYGKTLERCGQAAARWFNQREITPTHSESWYLWRR